jgi:hypothetical protein
VVVLQLITGALFFILTALAQTTATTGTIQGNVSDESGAAVPGARVSARNQDTKIERTTQTDGSGNFTLRALPIGTYTLALEAPGFSPVMVAPFLLSIGQIATQRVELRPAGIVERVDVKEEPEAIDTSAATASVALGYERIEEAPARSRNYLNFVLAAPAVAPSTGASSQRTMTGVRSPLGDSGFTFGGMRARNNSILIDGMDNRDETTGGNRVAVGFEMVQEFRVAGTAIGAELGGAAGGLLNMVTRSGQNIWHGDVTFFAQNEHFNARQAEVESLVTPRFRRYQPGLSANGPVRLDRTFVSGAIEQELESAQEWSNVPASAAELINRALSTAMFSRAPVRVSRGLYDTSTRGIELSAKLNHQLNDRDTLSARYAFSRGRLRHEVQGPDNFADRSAQGSSLTVDHSLVGNWLRVASPSVVNDLRVQVAERRMEIRPNASGAMLEIPGVAALGQFDRMNADRTERHYQVVENANFVLGGHRLSAGADAHVVTLKAALRNRYAGIFVFPTLEEFIEGRPDMFIQAFGDPGTSFATVPVGLWLQDRWEPFRGLLLEAGVRYDRQRMPEGLTPSSNNIAPRLGIAWRPSDKKPLVIRAGFGFFFDRYPLAYLNDALQKDGVRGFEQYAAGETARAAFLLGRGGTLAASLPRIAESTYRTSVDFPSTYSRKVNVGLEQGLGKDTSLSIEASHIRGVHLPRVRNITGTLPPAYSLEQTARSDYLGASISMNRRMNRELAYLIAYNVGRTKDDGSDFNEHPMDPLDIRRDWALSRQHQRHRLSVSALFELPLEDWGIVPNGIQEALDGVSFAPIYSAGSGRPLNALLTTDIYRTGAYPISARPPEFARNPFRSPATVTLDLRVMKTFHVLEGRALLQFGVESFNLLNHTNTERVSQYFATPRERLTTYAQTLESLPARQVQFLMQFEY